MNGNKKIIFRDICLKKKHFYPEKKTQFFLTKKVQVYLYTRTQRTLTPGEIFFLFLNLTFSFILFKYSPFSIFALFNSTYSLLFKFRIVVKSTYLLGCK